MDPIDFLLIGAQKSGTTALYQYLRAHPDIYLPDAKEVEFFSDGARHAKGLPWYLETYFAAAPAGARKGEATTHYMMFPEVPARIAAALPNVRLLAILRDPVERAYSHYRMSAMRGTETRSFDACVDALLASTGSEPPSPSGDYVRFGEYRAILSRYLDHFDRSQLCVLFYEDLKSSPRETVRRAFEFVGASPDFVPPNLGIEYNVGGRARAPRLVQLATRAVGRARRMPVLRRFITQDRYEGFKFWARTELGVRREKDPGPRPETRDRLLEHYAQDVTWLRSEIGLDPPWPPLAREAHA